MDPKVEALKASVKKFWWSYILQMGSYPWYIYVHGKVHNQNRKRVSQ